MNITRTNPSRIKKAILVTSLIFLNFTFGFSQWTNDDNGNNSATGNVSIGGSFISSNYYGLLLQPTGDAVIKRTNSGSLMLSSGGGTSDIRFNYNYGGGSGGISVFDGGTTNHANFAINPSGYLGIFPSGGNVGIGTLSPNAQLEVFVPHNAFVDREVRVGSYYQNSFYGIGFNYRIDANGAVSKHIVEHHGSRLTSMTLKNGNVGIGKDDPAFKLDVNGPIATEGQAVVASNATEINFGDITANDGYRDNLNLLTHDLKRLSINGDGNVAIGSGNFSHRLSVLSTSENVLAVKSTSHSVLDIESGSGLNSYVRFQNNGTAKWDLASEAGGGFRIYDYTGSRRRLVVTPSGNVGIGVDAPDQKLTVDGQVRCEEVKVEIIAGSGPDYVFEKDYNLPSLTSIESYIKENKHLPEAPSAKEMEKNGVNVGEMEMLLLKKIEELTLYVIELKKEIAEQSKKVEEQSSRIDAQEKEIKELNKLK
jgi:hypothetical protein